MLTTLKFNPISFDWNLLFTIINLVVFYLIFKKLLWGPVLRTLEKRKANIEKQYKDAQTAQDTADELKSQYTEKMDTVHEESAKMLEDAKANANLQAERIVLEAEKESQKLINDAHKNIENERQDTMRSVKSEIASIALDAAAKVVKTEAKNLDDSALYDEFLDNEENGDK